MFSRCLATVSSSLRCQQVRKTTEGGTNCKHHATTVRNAVQPADSVKDREYGQERYSRKKGGTTRREEWPRPLSKLTLPNYLKKEQLNHNKFHVGCMVVMVVKLENGLFLTKICFNCFSGDKPNIHIVVKS